MAEFDTISTILERCRFLGDVRELDATIPGLRQAIPPLTELSLKEARVGDVLRAYPVVPGPDLTELLVQFMGEAVEDAFAGAGSGQSRIHADMDRFQEEPYFTELIELVAETRAHGTIFRLDSVLWIHLSWLMTRMLHPDEAFLQWLRDVCPGVRDEALVALGRLQQPEGSVESGLIDVRRSALREIIARNEFANRSVARLVGDEQPNALHQALVANRLVFLLPPDFLMQFHARTLVSVKDFGLRATQVNDLARALRAIIEDLFGHRDERALSGAEQFFVTQFFDDDKLATADALDLKRLPEHAEVIDAGAQARLSFKVGWSLVFRDEVLRYLLSQLEQLNVRRALSGKHGAFSSKFLRSLSSPERLRGKQGRILELARQVRTLDLFETLHSFLEEVTEKRGTYFLGEDQLRPTAVPLDLGSYYETFRRNRAGTAVFIDLIGFTAKARELFFGRSHGSAGSDMEKSERGELAALALERLFRARQKLGSFGGRPEGFEGDAILDIFTEPLSALRYVAAFRRNFADNLEVQFRPLSKAVKNPFAMDGFRVGIATGEYTLVNVPDLDSSGEPSVKLRAIGPSINKASRLNTGKKGAMEHYLTLTREDARDQTSDPLDLFQVRVLDEDLNNTGICLDLSSYDELKSLVRLNDLPFWLPHGDHTFEIGGRDAGPKVYEFDLVFHDPDNNDVFALRRLTRVPKLKGLSRAESVVTEALVFSEEEYLEFLEKELVHSDEHTAPAASRSSSSLSAGQADLASTADVVGHYGGRQGEEIGGELGDGMGEELSSTLPGYLYGRPSEGEPSSTDVSGIEEDLSPAEEDEQAAASMDRFSLDVSLGGLEDSDDLGPAADSWSDLEDSEEAISGIAEPSEPSEPAAAPPDESSEERSAEEEWSDRELQGYMRDMLQALESDDADSVDAVDSVYETGQDMEAVDPAEAWQKAMTEPDLDAIDPEASPPTPPPQISQSLHAVSEPARSHVPDEPAPVGSLLGALDDGFAARLAHLLEIGDDEAPPWDDGAAPPESPQPDPNAFTAADLERTLKDYHLLVLSQGGEAEYWFGRLVDDTLFDLHQYVLAGGPARDDEAALREFIHDKVEEAFLPNGARYGKVPVDGAAPEPIPMPLAAAILRELV